jgi:hypothetical protein
MLAPCTSCRRHVRADEPACPFCGGAIGEPTNRAVPRAPRVAILFAGAIGLAGCSEDGGGAPVPVYGAPIDSAVIADTGRADTSNADTSMGSLYGGPPVDSAVQDTNTPDSAKDSGDDVEDTWSPVPPYGAPLLDAGDE